MDSPESTTTTPATATKTTAVNASVNATVTVSSNSPSIQESPFSNYVSSFSPLNIGNAAPHISQGFLGLNSPPLIFTTPRVNSRSQNPQLSSIEALEKNNRTNDWDKPVVELQGCSTTGPQEAGVKTDEQVQHSGSSDHVDEYLADPAEGSFASLDYSVDQKLKKPKKAPPNHSIAATDSLEGILEFEKKSSAQSGENASLILSKEAEADIKEQVKLDIEQVKSQQEKNIADGICNQFSSLESQHDVKCSGFQDERRGCSDECKFSSEMPSQHVQTAQTCEDGSKNVEPVSNRPLNNTILDSEVSQNQRGMSRRCLQFEEAQPKATVNTGGSLSVASDSTLSTLPGTAAESNTFGSDTSSGGPQLFNVSQPMATVFRPQNNGKSAVLLSKPSGIGLHLNSIVKAAQFGHDASESMKLAGGSMSIQGMGSVAIMSCHSLENTNGSDASAIPKSLEHTEALMLGEGLEDHTLLYDKRKSVPEHVDNFEEFGQQSLKKKKKKSSSGTDNDGCKRCNCKKTKCLKLYCDCFAAGIYCDETCSCQGCLNRPEHAETVLETRQQIESRNPLAFAPKIIQHGSEFSMNNGEEGNLTTPSSARHKRGCNCKKSMCLKKYCECYQGSVGCSSGCRCENCKNIYGKKDDYLSEEFLSNRVVGERSELDDKMEIVLAKKHLVHPEFNNMHKLTPVTPLFQHSDHGKGVPKSQLIVRRYHPPPDSDPTALPSHTKSDMGSNDQEADYSNPEIPDYFSSRFGSLVDTSSLTPLPNHPIAISSSASLGSSLRWRSSPITPGSPLGEGKSPQELDPDNILEAETPEILKDALTPIKPVKVSSPNRKRVSPPHCHLNQHGSSSSGPLKSGRKFILKAVPSFPPLTPCIESKALTKQTSADTQPSSGKE